MSQLPEISLNVSVEQLKSASQDPELVKMIEGCIANDRSAQEILYKKYYGKMMSLCMRYVKNRDDAMGILNYGFLKVYRSIGSYSWNGSFDGWVHRIVYHSIIDQLRSNMREMKTEEISAADQSDAMDTSGLQTLYAEDLYKLLDYLPDSSRVVFNMFALEGYKHEEISELLGISVGTSKWHVNQARTQLKELILKHHMKS